MALLEIKNLKTQFTFDKKNFLAVDDISFQIQKGQTLGLVGESGCGKSVTSLSILRLIQSPGKIIGGEILFEGIDLLKLSDKEMRKIRGQKISMIFQEPMTALNPVFTCGQQIQEVLKIHFPDLGKKELEHKTIELLKTVGIPSAERRINDYPHQLSGGMRQRVMIAMAMSCQPQLLIADEPTTALDVTIQAQILDLMRKMQQQANASMLLITHDLGVVAEMCQQVAIMYAGKIVEYGPVTEIFKRPKHPYTKGLLDSVPHFETGKKLNRLNTIPGMVPNLSLLPSGCRFAERCNFKQELCQHSDPVLKNNVACHFPLETKSEAGVNSER